MREPDHLAKAVREMLKPIVAAHGFQQYGARTYFRLCGWIAQFLDLRKSAWGGGSFRAHQYIFLLIPPQDGLGGGFSGSLPPKGQAWGREGWWESSTPELALRSVDEICDIFETVAMPRFQQGSTLSGFIEALRPEADTSRNTHFKNYVGCALVCDGRLEEGIPYLQRAERDFRAGFVKMPAAAWMETEANYMKALLDAISTGQHRALLDEWFQSSVRSLKIDKKWKTDDEANKSLI
jgi:hypothetical protein